VLPGWMPLGCHRDGGYDRGGEGSGSNAHLAFSDQPSVLDARCGARFCFAWPRWFYGRSQFMERVRQPGAEGIAAWPQDDNRNRDEQFGEGKLHTTFRNVIAMWKVD